MWGLRKTHLCTIIWANLKKINKWVSGNLASNFDLNEYEYWIVLFGPTLEQRPELERESWCEPNSINHQIKFLEWNIIKYCMRAGPWLLMMTQYLQITVKCSNSGIGCIVQICKFIWHHPRIGFNSLSQHSLGGNYTTYCENLTTYRKSNSVSINQILNNPIEPNISITGVSPSQSPD